MPKIEMPKSVKRPEYMIKSDKDKVKITVSEAEQKLYAIAEHNAIRPNVIGIEHSNIPELYKAIWPYTVMTQVMEALDNEIICVNEHGVKVNTNEGDYDCAVCDHFCNDPDDELVKSKYPHGYCKFATSRWIEKFGSIDYRPEGLADLQGRLNAIGTEKQQELTPEEVLKFTEGIDGGWVDEVRKSISG